MLTLSFDERSDLAESSERATGTGKSEEEHSLGWGEVASRVDRGLLSDLLQLFRPCLCHRLREPQQYPPDLTFLDASAFQIPLRSFSVKCSGTTHPNQHPVIGASECRRLSKLGLSEGSQLFLNIQFQGEPFRPVQTLLLSGNLSCETSRFLTLHDDVWRELPLPLQQGTQSDLQYAVAR